jgi:hypothetical protein
MIVAPLRRAFARVRSLVVLICAAASTPALGQSAVLQGGPWQPGHAPMYVGRGSSQPVVQDSGPASGGAVGVGLSELGITARGTGTPPYVGQGTGPFGTNFCDYDAPTTNATGYHFLCFSANAQGGGGMIAYGAGGVATPGILSINVNGTVVPFPGPGTGSVVGPTTTTVGNIALWNNTTGTILSGLPAGTSSQVLLGGTTPSWTSILPAGLTIPWTQTGAGAVPSTVSAKLQQIKNLDDYKSVVETDDCAAFQRAHDDNNGGKILLPNRQLEMGTALSACQINWTNNVHFEGTGWSETATSGTIIHIPNASLSPFYINGTGAKGSSFSSVTFKQDHPTPVLGWTPTLYPPVIDEVNVGGEIDIENVLAYNVYDFVKSANSGRLNVRHIRGQVFHRVVDIDEALDSPRFFDFHIWPYAYDSVYVNSYTQANLDTLYLGRADTTFADDIFCIFCRSIIHTVTTAHGNPTKLLAGKIGADFSKYGVFVESVLLTSDIAALNFQGEVAGGSGGVPNGRAIFLAGDATRMRVAGMQTQIAEAQVIEVFGSFCSLEIGGAHIADANLLGTATGLVKVVGANSYVSFATPPVIDTSGSATLADTGDVSVSMQQIPVAGQANEMQAIGALAGSGPILNPIGSDTNIDLNLGVKGLGVVKINGPAAVSSNQPTFRLLGLSQPVDQRIWDFFEDSSGDVHIRALNDAYSAGTNFMNFNRGTGATITGATIDIIPPTQLGSPGATQGSLLFAGSTSGATTITGQAVASGTLTLPARTANVATTVGALTNGHCVSIDASGNLVDAGGTCTTGGGGGTVGAGTAGQLSYYSTTGANVIGNPNLNVSAGALTLGQAGSVQGSILFAGSVGSATTLAAPTTGGGTMTLPAGSGTLATTANIASALPSATTSQIYIGTGAAGAAAASSAIPNGVTATTQATTDYSTKVATTAFIGNVTSNCITPFSYMSSAQVADVQAGTLTLDVTTPLQNFFNAIVDRGNYCLPAGLYKFTSALSIPYGVQMFSLTGDGRYNTQLVYSGASSTIDWLTIGSTTVSNTDHNTYGLKIGGFSVRGATGVVMTSGAAFHFGQLSETDIFDVSPGGGVSFTTTAWNGFYFDGAHHVTLSRSEGATINDGLIVRGVNGSSNADMTVSNSFLNLSGNTGIRLAGGFGGLYLQGVQLLGNYQYNMVIDDSLQTAYSVGNREILIDPLTVMDGVYSSTPHTANDNLYINSPASSNASIIIHAFIGSAATNGINIQSFPSGIVNYTAGRLFNNQNDGVHIVDTTTRVIVGPNVTIDNNAAYGVNAATPTTNTSISANVFGNVIGNIGANVGGWTSYTLPGGSITSSSGTITTASGTIRYQIVGKTLTYSGVVTITTNGTGAGSIIVAIPWSLPTTYYQIGAGAERAISGKGLQVLASTSAITMLNYDGTYPGQNGAVLSFSGTAELLSD